MIAPVAIENVWWVASRSAGVLALLLLTVSMIAGLLLGGRLAGPKAQGLLRPAALRSLHEQLSLAALSMIVLHGVTLLGDSWLKPTVADIVVPFAGAHEPVFTGLGIVAAYVSLLLGLSYYARSSFGPARWRRLHRFVAIAYGLAVVHTLGAGTDADRLWLFVPTVAGAALVSGLLVVRTMPQPAAPVAREESATPVRNTSPQPMRHSAPPPAQPAAQRAM